MKHELLVRSKGKCQKCRISLKGMKPDIHHKNRDPSDNKISNLMVLCRNCHSKMHFNKDGTLKKSISKISRQSTQNEKPISKKELLNQLPKTKLKKIVKNLDLDYDEFWEGDEKENYVKFLSSSRKVTVVKIRGILDDNNAKSINNRKLSNQKEKSISKKELLNQLPMTKLKKVVKKLDLDYGGFWDEKEDYIDILLSSRKATVKKIEEILGR